MRALKPRVKLLGFVAALLAGVMLVSVDEAGARSMTVTHTTHAAAPVATRDHRTSSSPTGATRDHRTSRSSTGATRDHRTSRNSTGAPTVEVRDHRTSRSSTGAMTVTPTVTVTRRARNTGSGSTLGTVRGVSKKVINTLIDPASLFGL
jgi:hypothetical protein